MNERNYYFREFKVFFYKKIKELIQAYTQFSEVQQHLKAGKVTVADLVTYYTDRIAKYNHLNAFLEVFKDEALDRAKVIQEKINNGTAGKLAGMIIGLKDNISYKGHQMTASSKILDGYQAMKGELKPPSCILFLYCCNGVFDK